mgnify:CR=1 FL=1
MVRDMKGFHAERLVRKFFPPDFTDRERAIFEAGIAMGSILHSLIGIPYASRPQLKHLLSKALEQSFLLQPYRRRVRIRLTGGRRRSHPYGYDVLKPENIIAEAVTSYGEYEVTAKISYIPQLKYPLIHVARIRHR